MPRFHYKAIDVKGEKIEGTVEAVDRFDVYRIVRKEGRNIISVKEEKERFSFSLSSLSKLNEMIGTVKLSDKIIFTRNMAAMIDAGLTISRALTVMQRQMKNPIFKRTLKQIDDDIRGGSSFNDALRKFPKIFSPLFVSMVHAGEEGGVLGDSLRTIAQQMDRAYTLKKNIRGALIYPTIVIIAMVIIGILMLLYVVPTLSSTFSELGADLPGTTQAVISASNFIIEHTFVTLILMALTSGSFVYALHTRIGKRIFDAFILHLPIIKGLVHETNAARTTRTLSSLLVSGVEVIAALKITREVVQNSYYKDVIKLAEQEIEKGAPISKVFLEHDKLYPALVGEIIAVGEETGKLSEMLMQIATFYEDEVAQKTKDMSTIIEPFLMLIIGAGVGFFAMAMIAPIYSLSNII
ncbi:type II secretion system F family protein [Patescibacteria group bacterium]|nr:type II secretion system F family protein [Patescibacteria group bacterium]